MITGLDTGFFHEMLKGNPQAIDVWNAALNDQLQLVVSCLSLFEIERLGLKGKIRGADDVLESIHGMCGVVWLDEIILSRGARLSHGCGIPAVDALILASLLSAGSTEIFTTDTDLETYKDRHVTIRNLTSPTDVQ